MTSILWLGNVVVPRMSLECYVRRWKTEGFVIDGDVVRIGELSWTAQRCACGLAACEGWAMIPMARRA